MTDDCLYRLIVLWIIKSEMIQANVPQIVVRSDAPDGPQYYAVRTVL
jgi:hypothetical protein